MSGNLPEVLSQKVAKLRWEPWEPAALAHRLRSLSRLLGCSGELGFDPTPILLSDIVQHTPPAHAPYPSSRPYSCYFPSLLSSLAP